MPGDKAARLVALLSERGRTVTAAESLTGGRIAAAITAVPGSSRVFPGGVVSYCDRVKQELLGVPAALLETDGAVSAPVAEAMARGAASLLGTDLAVAATGLAGPDGDGVHPVGTVFLGLLDGDAVFAREFHFSGDRAAVQAASVEAALDWLLEQLGDEAWRTSS